MEKKYFGGSFSFIVNMAAKKQQPLVRALSQGVQLFLQCFPEQGAGKAHPKFVSQDFLPPFNAISSSWSGWYAEQGSPAPFTLKSITGKSYHTSESIQGSPVPQAAGSRKTQKTLKNKTLPDSIFMKVFLLWQYFLWWALTTPPALVWKDNFCVQISRGQKKEDEEIIVSLCFNFFFPLRY